MGEVYRARDTRLDRDVAIKVLPPQPRRRTPEALARFEREAKAVAALSHPNILAIYDVGTHEGTAFVVTELLEGETLRERLRRRRPAAAQGGRDRRADRARASRPRTTRASSTATSSPRTSSSPATGTVKILDFGLAQPVRGRMADEPARGGADSPGRAPSRAR